MPNCTVYAPKVKCGTACNHQRVKRGSQTLAPVWPSAAVIGKVIGNSFNNTPPRGLFSDIYKHDQGLKIKIDRQFYIQFNSL